MLPTIMPAHRLLFISCFAAVQLVFFRCDDADEPAVRNCRIKEMVVDSPDPYIYRFRYNSDGTLKSVTSPNYSADYKYEGGRLKTISIDIVGSRKVISYEYPAERLMTWTSTATENRIYNLYHTSGKIDSLIVTDAPDGQPRTDFHSYPVYSGNNVSAVHSGGGCCVYEISEVEYDNGRNPASLLRASTGVFTGRDLFSYEYFDFAPEQLAENNPARYDISGSYNRSVSFMYSYATQGSYPLRIAKYYDGNLDNYGYNFVYEHCE